jgi:hypothetical protein
MHYNIPGPIVFTQQILVTYICMIKMYSQNGYILMGQPTLATFRDRQPLLHTETANPCYIQGQPTLATYRDSQP